MARTSTTTARFNPFTMEELYAPMLRATEKHMEQQEKYDELANQALIWNYRLPNDPESAARKMYDAFNKNLETMTADLQTNGILTPSARDNFSNLRKTNPIPILEDAWNRREADRQMRAGKDDTVWLQQNSLDNYIYNTEDNTHQSLKDLRESGALLGSNLAKGLVDEPEFKPILGKKFYQEKLSQGIPNNVLLALQNENPTILTDQKDIDLYNDLYSASDTFLKNRVDRFGEYSDVDKARMKSSFWEGMTAGSQTTKYNTVSNPGYESRGARIAADINQFKYNEMVANKDRIDRLSTGKATPEDKWWARSNGYDPDTGTPISKSNSNPKPSGGTASDHIHQYSPNIMRSDGTVITNSNSINALRVETLAGDNKSQYKPVLFTELPTKYQKRILHRMGYTEKEQELMFTQREDGNATLLNEGLQFTGTNDLSPDFLNKFLSIELNPNTGDIYSVGKSWNTSAAQGQQLYELGEDTPVVIEDNAFGG